MAQDSRTEASGRAAEAGDPHRSLHSEAGAGRGEHPGRSRNPVIKVEDLAWLEFEKPDLDAAERFAHDFGFITAARTADTLYLRGARVGTQCVVIRKGAKSRFVGPAFKAVRPRRRGQAGDGERRVGARAARPRRRGRRGPADPSGIPLRVVAGVEELPELPRQRPLVLNVGRQVNRVNATQRPPREPARIERLGHVVLETTLPARPGLVPGQPRPDRQRLPVLPGPARAWPGDGVHPLRPGRHPGRPPHARDDAGAGRRYVHSAYQVADLDALAAGGEYLREHRYHHSWGIGRHIEGSQIFDYWRDPDGFLVEHFADGDMFDNTVETGWAQMSASHLNQWGRPATPNFLAAAPRRCTRSVTWYRRCADRNEFDLAALHGLVKVMSS